mmetsp:Transcript_5803/g.10436  ORF Transcript_5803/g.10436 Transcript_5803/m.10436 type:complete len:86 (+) Transcript_5803:699-956(+)
MRGRHTSAFRVFSGVFGISQRGSRSCHEKSSHDKRKKMAFSSMSFHELSFALRITTRSSTFPLRTLYIVSSIHEHQSLESDSTII